MTRELATVSGVALAAVVLASLPPTIAAASLVGAAFVGILTSLARWASGTGHALDAWPWRAAAGAGLASLAVLSLASWLGPSSVVVLAGASAAVMIYLSRLLLRRPLPLTPGRTG
jgi:hypothetical protein